MLETIADRITRCWARRRRNAITTALPRYRAVKAAAVAAVVAATLAVVLPMTCRAATASVAASAAAPAAPVRASMPAPVLASIPVPVLAPPAAPIAVRDDSGATVRLARPAMRVISLAPHATELLYAAGGGARLVGVVAFSDFPPAARALPQVGDSRALDLERIAALKPDLAVLWWHGTPARQVEQLRALGIPIFMSAPGTLDDVAATLEKFGTLLATREVAEPAAASFRRKIGTLRSRFGGASPVRVFYQIWDQPLMTLNRNSIVNDVLALCGGRNIFAGLAPIAPVVSTEAVLEANPAAILATSAAGLQHWNAWPRLAAVAQHNLLLVDGTLLERAGPRSADGAAALCAQLQDVRERATAAGRP